MMGTYLDLQTQKKPQTLRRAWRSRLSLRLNCCSIPAYVQMHIDSILSRTETHLMAAGAVVNPSVPWTEAMNGAQMAIHCAGCGEALRTKVTKVHLNVAGDKQRHCNLVKGEQRCETYLRD